MAWRGLTAETKGWTEWEGKEGKESEQGDVRGSGRKDGGNNHGRKM